nr:zinc finger, CCHC-type [Tanacetum cinerariifolium]
MLSELKSMFKKQARVERFDLIQTFHACKQEEEKIVGAYVLNMKGFVKQLECLGYVLLQDLSVGLILNGLTGDFVGFVRNYNMHNMEKMIGELHALLIEYEKGLPKKAATPHVMAIQDRGGEYISQEFKEYLKACRIVQQLTPTYTSQHNGVSERRNSTLLYMRYMMDNSKRGNIPMQERIDLNKTQGASTPEEVKSMQNVPYASAVGSIMTCLPNSDDIHKMNIGLPPSYKSLLYGSSLLSKSSPEIYNILDPSFCFHTIRTTSRGRTPIVWKDLMLSFNGYRTAILRYLPSVPNVGLEALAESLNIPEGSQDKDSLPMSCARLRNLEISWIRGAGSEAVAATRMEYSIAFASALSLSIFLPLSSWVRCTTLSVEGYPVDLRKEEVASSNHNRKKSFPPWKQQEGRERFESLLIPGGRPNSMEFSISKACRLSKERPVRICSLSIMIDSLLPSRKPLVRPLLCCIFCSSTSAAALKVGNLLVQPRDKSGLLAMTWNIYENEYDGADEFNKNPLAKNYDKHLEKQSSDDPCKNLRFKLDTSSGKDFMFDDVSDGEDEIWVTREKLNGKYKSGIGKMKEITRKIGECGGSGCWNLVHIWSLIRYLAGMENVPPIPLDIVMHLLPLSHKRTARSIVGRLILAAAAYHVWIEHNNRLFKNAKRTPEEIQDMVMVMKFYKTDIPHWSSFDFMMNEDTSDVGADMEIDDPPSDKKTMRPRRNLEKKEEKPRFSLTLSCKEIEDDFFAMMGKKLPHRPKRRSRVEQEGSILFRLPGSRQQKFLVLRFFDVKEQHGIDRLNIKKLDGNIVQKHGGSKQVGFKQLGLEAQRRLEDKHPEEKTNTDCLVKEQEKEYQTMWKIKTSNVLDFCNQRNMGFNESEKYKKTFIGSCVGTGSMQMLHRFEFEVEPLWDHTFEVEP